MYLAPRTPMDAIQQDIRYAFRRLFKSPGFALIATLTLALGIGANSAIFSVVNGVLLKPLPYSQPERLVGIFHLSEGHRDTMSGPNFVDVKNLSKTLADAAAISRSRVILTGQGDPVRLLLADVSASLFNVLGVRRRARHRAGAPAVPIADGEEAVQHEPARRGHVRRGSRAARRRGASRQLHPRAPRHARRPDRRAPGRVDHLFVTPVTDGRLRRASRSCSRGRRDESQHDRWFQTRVRRGACPRTAPPGARPSALVTALASAPGGAPRSRSPAYRV